MRLPLPYERFSIETGLSPQEVVRRIRLVTEASGPMRGRADTGCEFEGWVGDGRFQIVRRIRYRNSFRPVISGAIEAAPIGASVRASLKLSPGMLVFTGVWCGILTLVSVAWVAAALAKGAFTPFVLAPLVFWAFGYALVTGSFTVEARRARERLEELLRADGAPMPSPRYWPEGLLEFRWADVRAAGTLGLVWVGCYVVGGALGLYDWIGRQAGCTNQQAHDPAYSCPTGARVFSVWAMLAAVMLVTAIGIWPVRRKRPHLLVPIILAQIVAIIVLAWVAHDPAFHVHQREPWDQIRR